MILDIVQTIVNYCKIESQIMCTKINTYLCNNINIYSFTCTFEADLSVVMQRKYSKLKIMYCDDISYILSVNHLADTLEELYCECNGGICGINQDGISRLKKLKILDCSGNWKIYALDHLAGTLEKLYCSGSDCGIDQNVIDGLYKLKVLNCCHNKDIYNVNHLAKTLRKLYCCGGEWNKRTS